tara:strand:- start:787 stop:1029 length:243 start_codon:yes stop_codon:yes gene_type:complete
MKYDTNYYRLKNGIDPSLPLNFKNVWTARMPEVKRMLVTMSIRQIAKHYGVSSSNVSQAMSVRNIQARRVRHDHKKSLSN